MNAVGFSLAAAAGFQSGVFFWALAGRRRAQCVAARSAPVALWRDPWELAGYLGTGAGWLMFLQALGRGDISLVQPWVVSGSVVLGMGAGLTVFRNRLTVVDGLGLLLVLAGAVLLVAQGRPLDGVVGPGRPGVFFVAVGLTFLLLSGVVWVSVRKDIPLALLTGLAVGTAAVVSKLYAGRLAAEGVALLSVSGFVNGGFVLALAAQFGGLFLLQAAVRRGRLALTVPLYLSVSLCVGCLGGAVVFQEILTPARIAAVAGIVAGSILIHQSKSLS